MSGIPYNILNALDKTVFDLQQKYPLYGNYYHKYQYVRPYEQIRFDDAPEPIYGFTVRTRQIFPCEGKFQAECVDLESRGKVVECDQDRFRFAYA